MEKETKSEGNVLERRSWYRWELPSLAYELCCYLNVVVVAFMLLFSSFVLAILVQSLSLNETLLHRTTSSSGKCSKDKYVDSPLQSTIRRKQEHVFVVTTIVGISRAPT